MAEDRIILNGLGPFRLPNVQRSSVRLDKEGVLITLRVVGGEGTVPVSLQMLPRTASELAAQIVATVPARGSSEPLAIGAEEAAAVDAWIARQPEPRPSRSDVIRLALSEWMSKEP